PPTAPSTPAPSAPGPSEPAGSTSNCLAPPFVVSSDPSKHAYTTPKDITLTRQADANCFAWQEFISLGWVASPTMRGQPDTSVPPSKFGTPLDTSESVWESYKEANEVFLPDAKNPGQWNSAPGSSIKLLGGMKSELDPVPTLDLSEVGQASQGHPWLTAQNGLLTLYERRMNEDEFNYIVQNKLYDATVQQTFVQSPGINLPDGTASSAAYGSLGAIETKAAWIELPNQADWPRFKTSWAMVQYPGQQQPKKVVVGLVGLHIIHKTALGQQFIWATFEHRDNAPNREEVASGALKSSYTYFNPKCDPATDYYKCTANANPVTYKGADKTNPYNAPIQVVREVAIPSRPNDDVVSLNQYVWNQLRAANPNSVYLNYQLVNTLWSNQNTPIPAGSHVPLFAGQLSPGPQQEPVANTVLETYVQNLTCLACHASAPIATVKTPPTTLKVFDPAKYGTPAAAQNAYASDYSFLFESAQTPKTSKSGR
ncbi:MAG TPA: hypothetical protein VEU33_25675, partial [Archangium sp.]|nr:hypothetical protein [Archangium sp.]